MNPKLLLIICLFAKSYTIPLLSTVTKCIDQGTLLNGDCFKTYEEIALDLKMFGEPISKLAEVQNAEENPFKMEQTPEPTKTLTLGILEEGIKLGAALKDAPVGYLAKFGYLKGALKAVDKCDDTITSEEMILSLQTFFEVTRAKEVDVFSKMNAKRCSCPDITFDEDGHLDESSAELMSKVLDSGGKPEHAARLRRGTHERRRKRYALKQELLDLSEKSEYSFKLHNRPTDQKLNSAHLYVGKAFQSWRNAIGSAITFVNKTDETGDADVNLKFVPDVHEDYNFSSIIDLAHAPFPSDPYHGSVHYRDLANWDEDDPNSFNFLYVTVHELGHFLGLKHSVVPGSVMEAIIGDGVPNDYSGILHDDDILGVKIAYGASNTRCPNDWWGFEGVCYKTHTVSTGITWDESQLKCKEEGSQLASVTNGPLNTFLLQKVANGRTPLWIGRKSTNQGWVNNQPFDWYPKKNRAREMNPTKERCLRLRSSENTAVWQFIKCDDEEIRTEHFVCGKVESVASTTAPPTTAPHTSTEGEKPTSRSWPCQNYVRAALRRGNYIYLFGNSIYAKYYQTSGRPRIAKGYPKYISDEFDGIPPYFTATANSPYQTKIIYFVAGDDVYEWKLKDANNNIEEGQLRRKKPREMVKVFKKTGILSGATIFDANSIFLFDDTGEVGKWSRKFSSPKKSKDMVSKYEEVKKWTFDINKINAVTESHFKDYLIFFRGDSYFYLRKTDGKMPQAFKRVTSSDFPKFEICSVLAPFVEEYPDGLHPDDALRAEQ